MKSKNFLLSVLFILYLAISSFSVQEKKQNENKFFLWKISRQSSQSYVLGSIHFLKKEMYPLPARVENAFEESDVLVVEADISNTKMAQYFNLTMQKGMYSGNETLKDNISEKTFLLAEKILKKKGIDINLFQKFKPWFLALTISGIELLKLGFDPNYGVDKYFINKANRDLIGQKISKKEIIELEGIEYQISLFNELTRTENDSFLFYTLKDISQYSNDINPMVSAWAQGQVSKIEQLLTKNINEYKELSHIYKKFVDDRNFQMVDKIESYLKSPRIHFIVVGAAHLVGKHGIIQLLKNKGFLLKQM